MGVASEVSSGRNASVRNGSQFCEIGFLDTGERVRVRNCSTIVAQLRALDRPLANRDPVLPYDQFLA
jgi:hypothetical protein